jgi:thiol-disulfide isomerase/thioredoxin
MNKLLISLCCTVFSISLFSQYSYTLQGSVIPNEFNNKTVYLVIKDNYSDNRYEKNDSCIIVNNKFHFTGTTNRPSEWAQIYIKNTRNFLYFALDTGLTELKIEPLPKNSVTYKNKFSNPKFVTSESNKLFRQIDSLIVRYYTTFAINNKSSGVIQLSKEKNEELKLKQLKILQQYPNIYYSLIHLYELLPKMLSKINYIEETFNSFSDSLKLSSLGVEFYDKLESIKSGLIGNNVPEFAVKTPDESIVSSENMHGKSYLLAFGATWCLPCKENYPMLKALHQKYKDKGFEIISVNLDDDSLTWKKQIELYALNWINVSELKKWEESKMAKSFNIRYVPTYMIIDKNGKIIYHTFQLLDGNHKLLETYVKKAVN